MQPNINKLKINKTTYNSNNELCETIDKTESIKYLGITIDQHLKWDIHVNNLIIKTRKLNYFYINSRKIPNKKHYE